jgi:hypothetical protein
MGRREAGEPKQPKRVRPPERNNLNLEGFR